MNRNLLVTVAVQVCAVIAVPSIAPAQERALPTERIVFSGNETDRCLKCHGMPNFAFRLPQGDIDRLRNLTVPADTFRTSVHKDVSCQHCHVEIKEYPHTFAGVRPRVSCGTDCHAVDTSGRTYTHATIVSDFRGSVHGRGMIDSLSSSPHCESCHGGGNPHAIHRAKGVLTKMERMDLCIPCHENREAMLASHVDPEAVSSYRKSFHYKAIRFGGVNTATCQDCHGVHSILPADSARSTIAPANIAATCGQQSCHPGVNLNFAMSGANHLNLRIEKSPILFVEEKLFIVLTAGTMLMLVAGIILDIQKKFGWLELLMRAIKGIRRRLRDMRDVGAKAASLARRLLID